MDTCLILYFSFCNAPRHVEPAHAVRYSLADVADGVRPRGQRLVGEFGEGRAGKDILARLLILSLDDTASTTISITAKDDHQNTFTHSFKLTIYTHSNELIFNLCPGSSEVCC